MDKFPTRRFPSAEPLPRCQAEMYDQAYNLFRQCKRRAVSGNWCFQHAQPERHSSEKSNGS